jgi:hypothetical protein
MPASIQYRDLEKYKYQLMESYVHETGLTLPAAVATTSRQIGRAQGSEGAALARCPTEGCVSSTRTDRADRRAGAGSVRSVG